jgi:alpha-L-fucosidase 2
MRMSLRRISGTAAVLAVVFGVAAPVSPLSAEAPASDPATVLWYTHPADKWENALPVGNGRLGAMVFG